MAGSQKWQGHREASPYRDWYLGRRELRGELTRSGQLGAELIAYVGASRKGQVTGTLCHLTRSDANARSHVRMRHSSRASGLSCHHLPRIELAVLHHVSARRLQCRYGLVNKSVHSRLSRRCTCLRDQFPGILQISHRCWV